jgi:putative endopeptidase
MLGRLPAWTLPMSRSNALLGAGAAALVLLSACSRPAEAPAPAAKPAPATAAAPGKPELGRFGFDLAGMDRSVAPGDNFYDFANGNWVKTTEIPADRSNYGSFALLAERALERTRAIIDEAAAKGGADAGQRKIGDFYKAYMDEPAIEARGLAPVKPELDAIAAVADKRALADALGRTLRADVDVLNTGYIHTDRLFGLWVAQHLQKPETTTAYLLQGGLGLPDRDFYTQGGRFVELRKAYQAHIAKLMSLAGYADAEARAAKVMALETAIARTHESQEESYDVKRGANVWQRADFGSKAPGLDWEAYFAAAGLGQQGEFFAWQPGAIAGISALVGSQPLDTWKDYLAFHALDRASALLPKAFADERFAFYGKTVSGTPEQSPRWKRGVGAVNGALGEAVGKIYVQRHFSPETKTRADELVRNLLAAFGKRIDALDWMDPKTRERAKAKLAGMKVGMGYPDVWRDYGALEVKADDALGNAERASLFEYRRNLAKLGKPAEHGEWYFLPQVVNAMNIPLENRLIFPAAILEAPFFDPNADDAVNYGAIGTVIGHEISHSFDSSGALFDESGRLSNWWTPEDFKKFEAACAALAAQYDTYRPFPDLHVNGKLTLAENIADVAGLATAYDAYTLAREGKPAVTLDGLTPDQRFFLGFAQAFRGKYREATLRNLVMTDGHSPSMFRTEAVRNLDAWYAAFDVRPGQERYLPPNKRVHVW